MRRIYLDAGRGDEWYLDLGAQAFADELDKLGVEYTLELFDGKHGGHGLPVSGRDPRARHRSVVSDAELAFAAAPGAIAELVRTGEVSAARAGRALPTEDRGARSAAERVPDHVRRAGAGRGRRRRRSRTVRSPGSRSRSRTTSRSPGRSRRWARARFGPPAVADAEAVRRSAGRRGDPDRDHERARADDLPVDERPTPTVSRATHGISNARRGVPRAGRPAPWLRAWCRPRPARTAADRSGSRPRRCGLVGMKPTRGRVSAQPDGQGWLGLSVFGALARTVADSALMLDVMQGADARRGVRGARRSRAATRGGGDAAGQAARSRSRRKVPPGLVAPGLAATSGSRGSEPAELLGELGHEVVERSPAYGLAQLDFVQMWLRGIYEESLEVPDRDAARAAHSADGGRRPLARAAWPACAAARHRSRRRSRPDHGAVGRGRRARHAGAGDDRDRAGGGYRKPAPLAIDVAARFTPFTPLFNLTGQPAIAIPAGIGADGLPLSVQLVGRLGAEDLLYSLAGQLESAAPWAQRRPPLASNLRSLEEVVESITVAPCRSRRGSRS